jgi:outer membrane lipoprotein-sorting protein
MSRVRIGYIIACFGILITTGGCAESATAPEAASAEASLVRGKKSAPAEEVVVTPSSDDSGDVATISGGVILSGGGRYDQP